MCTEQLQSKVADLKLGGLPTSVRISNGDDIPTVGFGTFSGEADNSGVKNAVLAALKAGYRHIDTAHAYGNEVQVGEAIREAGIPRDELYVVTKLHQIWHQPEEVEEAIDLSLKNLGLEYVDLYLMHFPHAYKPGPNHSTIRHPSGNGKPVVDYQLSRDYTKVWAAMEDLVRKEKAKSIGLSNFNIIKTKRIMQMAKIKPVVNQVEMHPYLPQKKLLQYCKDNYIQVIAHQPLGGNPVSVVNPNSEIPGPLHDAKIKEVARKLGSTPAQVMLSWAVQRGTVVIPKSVHGDRIKANIELVELSTEDFSVLDNLRDESNSVRYLDPRNHLGFDIFSEMADEPLINRAPWEDTPLDEDDPANHPPPPISSNAQIESAIPRPDDNKAPALDPNVLVHLPEGSTNHTLTSHGASFWTRTARIDCTLPDGKSARFFLKAATGERGKAMLSGEFKSMTALHTNSPTFAPAPIAWGSYKNIPDTYFFLCEFVDMIDMLPDPEELGQKLAALHRNGTSPNGKYGFDVTTFNGNQPQDNTWNDSWEAFFIQGLKHMLALEEISQGPSEQLNALKPALFEKVIPRLLRPLESGGRSIKPSMVHGDLWCGNVSVATGRASGCTPPRASGDPVIYDACVFYAHNEYELGNWRPVRNKFGRNYVTAYRKFMPVSEPAEDADDRNALYALRFNVQASALFPENPRFRKLMISEIQRLVNKFPNGFADFKEKDDSDESEEE